MTNFVIITYIPRRQGFLAPIAEKVLLEESEAENIEEIREGLHVPLDGYCLVAEEQHVTRITADVRTKMEPYKVT